MSIGYAILVGVALAAFNISMVPKKYAWVSSALLIAARVWFFSGATLHSLFTLCVNVGYYPALAQSSYVQRETWDTVILLLSTHIAFGCVQYGLSDTIHYNAHYLGVFLISTIYARLDGAGISMALFQSMGVFDIVSLLYTVTPRSLKGVCVMVFGVVRVFAYALMIHWNVEQHGRPIMALVLTCQLWILYLLVMQFAPTKKKRKQK